jgi:hypothetical protein
MSSLEHRPWRSVDSNHLLAGFGSLSHRPLSHEPFSMVFLYSNLSISGNVNFRSFSRPQRSY